MTSPRPVDKRLESGRKSCVVREFLRGFGDQKFSGDSLSTGGGCSQIFLIFTHFDEHIFSNGLVKNHQLAVYISLPETKSSHLKIGLLPPKDISSSNHQFSGAKLLVFQWGYITN